MKEFLQYYKNDSVMVLLYEKKVEELVYILYN